MNPKIMGGGMKVGRCEKESFVVIGKEGTTTDGDDLFNDYLRFAEYRAYLPRYALIHRGAAT